MKLLSTLLLFASTIPVQAETPRASIDASVKVELSNGPMIFQGSGTHIGQGLILTCKHVVAEGQDRAKVRFPDGVTRYGKVVAVCDHSDLALIQLKNAEDLPSVSVARELDKDDTAYQVGYPHGYGPDAKEGRMTGYNPDSNIVRIHVDDGDSGGGVFDTRGKLIGVLWGHGVRASERNDAMSVTHSRIRRFLAERR